MKKNLYETLEENNAAIRDLEDKIDKLYQEVKYLAKQGKIEEMLTKKIEIAEMELNVNDIKGLNNRECNRRILEEIASKKEEFGSKKTTKLYNEYKNLYECYLKNNGVDSMSIQNEINNLKINLLYVRRSKKSISDAEYTQQINELNSDKNMYDIHIDNASKNLDKSKEVYEKSGGIQGSNIDFTKSYEDILKEFEIDNGIEQTNESQDTNRKQDTNERKDTNNKQPYERKVSARIGGSSISIKLEEQESQNINASHQSNIYHFTDDLEDRFFVKFANEAYEKDLNNGEYATQKICEQYSKGLTGDKAKLAEQFAKLELNARFIKRR